MHIKFKTGPQTSPIWRLNWKHSLLKKLLKATLNLSMVLALISLADAASPLFAADFERPFKLVNDIIGEKDFAREIDIMGRGPENCDYTLAKISPRPFAFAADLKPSKELTRRREQIVAQGQYYFPSLELVLSSLMKLYILSGGTYNPTYQDAGRGYIAKNIYLMQQAMKKPEFVQKLPDEVLLVILFNMLDLHDAFVSRFLQSEPYNLDLDKNWRLIPHGSSGIDSEAYRPFSHVQRGVPSKEFAEMLTRQRRKIYRELLSRWKTKAALKENYKLFLEYRKPQDSPFNMVRNITAHKRHAALLETDLLSVD